MSEILNLPDGWEIKPLQSIGTCKNGLTYSPDDIVENGGLLVLRSSNIQNSQITLEDNVFVREDIKLNYKVQENDILVCVRNGSKDLIGKNALITKEIENMAHGAFMTIFHSHINKYVFQLFQSDLFFKQVEKNLGATINSINNSDLLLFEFPFPKEKKEQKKIAKILSTLDKVIESTNLLIEKEKNIKTALMQELLSNGIDKNGQIRTKATHLYNPSELGLVPDEWEVDKINEVTKLMTDFVANGSFESLADNVTVFENPDFAYYVRLVDIRKGLGHEKQTYVDEISFNFLKKSSLIGREILIANIGANVGETFLMPILNKPATIAPNMIVVKVNNKIIPEFLFYFLTFYKGISELQNVTEGSGQPKINKTKLKTINVVIPSIQEQEKIINILTTQDKKIEIEETNLFKLKELKKGLMNDLLSGRVRVKV